MCICILQNKTVTGYNLSMCISYFVTTTGMNVFVYVNTTERLVYIEP